MREWRCALVVLVLACGDEGCGSGDVCPPEPVARAAIHGILADSDGVPRSGVRVDVACDEVGVYDDRTDSEGRFVVRPVYAPSESPEIPGELLLISCSFNVADVVLAHDVPVVFYPVGMDVEPGEIELTYDS